MLKKIRSYCNKTNLFLLIVFIIGILTTIPYGAFLDQSTEQYILYSNIKEYLLHLPGDHEDILKILTDAGVEEISVSIDRYNGMAIYYLAFPVWHLNRISPYLGNIYWHVCIFALVFWGIVSLFRLIHSMFGDERIAAFTTLLFFLTPRMFSECHYNNKDMVVLSLTFVLMHHGMRLMKEQSVKSVCTFAVAGAFLSNMKIVGVWIFGVLGCYILAYFILTKQFDRKICVKALSCVALWGAVYVLITPACWNDIREFFEFLISCATDFRWHDYILFNGNMYNKEYTGMPRSYLPVMMLTTIPVGTLFLGLAGFAASAADSIRGIKAHFRIRRQMSSRNDLSQSASLQEASAREEEVRKKRYFETAGYVAACGLAGFVPLIYAVVSATPVYNGWRHFYFVYASVIVSAGYGIDSIVRFFRGKKVFRLLKIDGAAYLLILAVGIALNYPQNYSYYNVLAGTDVSERFELDYWGLSTKQAYEIILKDTDREKITVGALNNPTRWGLEENMQAIRGKKRMRLEIAEEWQDADYLIVNTTYAKMYSGDEYEFVQSTYESVDSIVSYGNTICEVYKKQYGD